MGQPIWAMPVFRLFFLMASLLFMGYLEKKEKIGFQSKAYEYKLRFCNVSELATKVH